MALIGERAARSSRRALLGLLLLVVDVVQTVHAELVVVSADVEVEAERCEGRDKSKEGESKQRLVNPADHDACGFLPVLDIAVVGQSRSHVPSQETPTHSPYQSQKAVDGDIEIRFEADAAMQDYGESKGSNGEEGRGHEQNERPRRLPVVVRQVIHEEAHDPTYNQTCKKLAEA